MSFGGFTCVRFTAQEIAEVRAGLAYPIFHTPGDPTWPFSDVDLSSSAGRRLVGTMYDCDSGDVRVPNPEEIAAAERALAASMGAELELEDMTGEPPAEVDPGPSPGDPFAPAPLEASGSALLLILAGLFLMRKGVRA